jgi:hypothetical protein
MFIYASRVSLQTSFPDVGKSAGIAECEAESQIIASGALWIA